MYGELRTVRWMSVFLFLAGFELCELPFSEALRFVGTVVLVTSFWMLLCSVWLTDASGRGAVAIITGVGFLLLGL